MCISVLHEDTPVGKGRDFVTRGIISNDGSQKAIRGFKIMGSIFSCVTKLDFISVPDIVKIYKNPLNEAWREGVL